MNEDQKISYLNNLRHPHGLVYPVCSLSVWRALVIKTDQKVVVCLYLM